MEKPQEEKQPLTTKQTVTMTELLEKELALEEEAAAQQSQNWGDETRCTFSDGYKNQPVYSCETCSNKDENKKQFGFCYGCSMNCHLDHVVQELFEKRHFRCDCGTPKSGCVCNFANSKDDKSSDNVGNVYNHNFNGLYCYCDGIYDSANMIMYQCIMCLDWFHIECIKAKEPDAFIPSEDIPCDFLCCQCVENNPFLFSYSHLLMNESKPENKKEETVDVTSEECKLKNSSQTRPSKPQKTFFFEDGWKNELCRCQSCMELYKKQDVEYLLEPDAVEEEEETSGETVSMLEYSQNAFLRSNIPHTSKVDIIQGYNNFVSNLKEYLKDFATNGKEVTKEDIQHFSEELQKKRRKLG